MRQKLLTVRIALLAVLSVMLALCLAVGIFLVPDKANAETNPVQLSAVDDFVIDETGKLTGLSEKGAAQISDGQYFELIIPAKVTQVNTADFKNNDKLVKLSFTENSLCSLLKTNGMLSNVFNNCTSLNEVDFTNAVNLTELGMRIFDGCSSLNKVVFADSLKDNAEMSISSNAFTKTALTSFEIPVYVTSIHSNAFSECTSLTTITVVSGNPKYTYYTDESGNRYDQAVYEKDADGNITALAIAPTTMTGITVPKAVLNVDYVPEEGEDETTTATNIADAVGKKAIALDGVLSGIVALEKIEMEENDELYAYGNCLFVKEGSKLTSYYQQYDLFTVPYSVKEITLPAGFVYAPDEGNYNAQSTNFWYYFLESVAPNVYGFVNMKQLKTINVDPKNEVFVSFEGSLFKKDYSECYVPYAATSFTIPKEIAEFDNSLLANRPYLAELKAAEEHPNYTSDRGIVYNKDKTEVVFVPSAITEFYVPETLQKISETAFLSEESSYAKNKITKVFVTDLEKWSQIQFGEPIETDEEYNNNRDGSLSKNRRNNLAYDLLFRGRGTNPMSGGADMYVQNNDKWELLESLVLDFDGEISELAFAGCKSLRTVTIGGKVTRIGEMSFAMCKNIRSMTVPFVGDRREYNIIRGDGYLLSSYAYAIFGGRGRSDYSGSIEYRLAPEKIDTFTVTGYNVETAPELRDDVKDISGNASYPVYGIPWFAFKDAPINKVVISIDNADRRDISLGFGAFSGSAIQEVDLKNSKVTSSQAGIFSDSEIKEIVLPETMTVIPVHFFFEQSGGTLEKVIIPENVENIEYQIFDHLNVLTLPRSIGGLDEIEGVKTVYLTGWTNYEDKDYSFSDQYDILSGETLYVATDADVYAALPENARSGSGLDASYTKVFYQADVVFRIKDSNGKVLAEKTETHLAAHQSDTTAYLKYSQITADNGDVYWALNENYTLPDTIGNYKVESTDWVLDGEAVTANTCLKGDKAQYVIEQTLSADSKILLTPENVVKQYDGDAWHIPDGMEIISVYATKGGNDYFSPTYDGMPVDMGTYSVTAKCKDGYAWYDDESATSVQRTFTLQIMPATATVEWFYSPDGSASGQNVTGTVPEHMYDGNSVHSRIYAEFTDVFGQTRRVDWTNLSLYSSGDRSTLVYSMTDTGTYDVTVNDRGKSTDNIAWLGNYAFEGYLQFGITPRVIDLNDYNSLAWGLKDYGSLLRDGYIYMYNNVPYAYEQPHIGTPDSVLYVLDSVVRFRESGEHEIVIGNIPALLSGNGAQYSAVYTDNTATEVGKYTAFATLTVENENYIFGYSLSSDLKSRGMNITINPDGSALISKVWYVVAIDNGMLNLDGTEYIIENWTFGDNISVNAPRLEHGDEAEDYLSNTNMRFTLKRGEETVASNFTREAFARYINKSMPAGRYHLICEVPDISVGAHTHWWNGEEHSGYSDADILYHGFTRELVFEVSSAAIAFTLPKLTDGGYADYEWKLDGDNKNGFFVPFENALDGKISLVSVERTGYWNGADTDKYYGSPILTYNLLRMNNQDYFGVKDANLLSLIKGGAGGTYTVYFQISALNHTPLTAMDDERFSYYFTVVVYETVATPTVVDEGIEYTGTKVLPGIAESELYEVIWDETDSYINGGAHSVSFRLYDNMHYRWAEDSTEDTVTVEFNVHKAENVFTVSLNMLGWSFETFDAAVNNIRATSRYLDSGESIRFKVVKDGETEAVAGLSDFTVDENGRVTDSVAAALNALKVGKYTLYATVKGTNNYNALERNITFNVAKAMNLWADGDEDLVLPSWVVGKYDETENSFVVNAAHGEVNIVITDIDGNEYYNSVTGVNNLNDCQVGKYLLKAWVDETDDYAALAERTFMIEVLEKVGLPWWAILIIVVGALGIAAIVLWILHEKGVLQMLTSKIVVAMRTKITVDATIAAVRANMVAENSKKTIAEAEKRDRIEALRKAREEGETKSAEELATALEEKALLAAQQAEKMQKRAEKIKKRAEDMRSKVESAGQETSEIPEQEVTAEEKTEDISVETDTPDEE